MSAPVLATKTCRICDETKPLSEFYRAKTNRDGYMNVCKSCQITRVRESQAEYRQLMGEKAYLARRAAIVDASRRRRGAKREREYNRAKSRAAQRLIDGHRREFDRYMAEELRAVEEAEAS